MKNIDADSLTALLMIIINLIIIEQMEIMLILVISSIPCHVTGIPMFYTEDHCAEQYSSINLIDTHIQNKINANFPLVSLKHF